MFKLFCAIVFLLSISQNSFAQDYTCGDKWPNASPPYYFEPNGCGPEGPLAEIIPDWYLNADLRSACNNHDRCWMTLKNENGYGACEAAFSRDLIKACKNAEICTSIFGLGTSCVPDPVSAGSCLQYIPSTYTGAVAGGAFLGRLKKSFQEQRAFEECVRQHGYARRPPPPPEPCVRNKVSPIGDEKCCSGCKGSNGVCKRCGGPDVPEP